MKQIAAIYSLLFVLSVCGAASATAQSAGGKCPKITLVGYTEPVEVGSPLVFTVNVDGDPTVEPRYQWTISSGKIAKGQGTFQITVDTAGMEGGSSVTATVEVKGFPSECFAWPSWTSDVIAAKKKSVETHKVDEFYGLAPAAEAARLDKVVDILVQDENIILWITTYPGKTSAPGVAEKDFKRLESYLLNTHRIKGWQIQPNPGGERAKPAIELWLADIKSPKPAATPPKP